MEDIKKYSDTEVIITPVTKADVFSLGTIQARIDTFTKQLEGLNQDKQVAVDMWDKKIAFVQQELDLWTTRLTQAQSLLKP